MDTSPLEVGVASKDRYSRKSLFAKTFVYFLITSVIFTIFMVFYLEPPEEDVGGIFDYSVTDLDGNTIKLRKYQHNVLLLVNIGNGPGSSTQLKGLQHLHEKYHKNGLVIIGFPTNQFTGNFKDNEEIKKFIDENNISFIVTKETKVNGFNQDSIYKYIGNESSSMKNINEDFEKILLNKNGFPYKRFDASTTSHIMAADVIKLLYTT